MKKAKIKVSIIFACIVLLSVLIVSCQDSTNDLCKNLDVIRRENSSNQEREIDWKKVAVADGLGAYYGAKLASKSGNVYVLIASAAGFAAYLSYDEYERQKEDLEEEEMIYYPDIINPYFPFNPNPLINNESYKINNEYGCVGEIHNSLLQSQIEEDINGERLDMATIFSNIYAQAFQIQNLSVEDFSFDLVELYEIAQEKKENHWALERAEIYDSCFDTLFTNSPIENTLEYINMATPDHIENLDSCIAYMSVSYYSKCLWNTMAPDPIIAQECILWSPNTEELQLITGRSNVVDCLANRDNDYVLYPAYNQSGIMALYLYTGTTQYGASEYISSITISSDFQVETEYYSGVVLDIPRGTYYVEPTICNDVYVISFQ